MNRTVGLDSQTREHFGEIATKFCRAINGLEEKLDHAIRLQRALSRPSKAERRAFAVLHAAACLYRPTDLRKEHIEEAVRIAKALLTEIEREEENAR